VISLSDARGFKSDALAISMQKLDRLKDVLLRLERVLVAYSGGVDSTLLLKVSRDVLGNEVVAVTTSSRTYPDRELEEAKEIAKMLGVRHVIIETHELENDNFASNPPDRCYYCKNELFSRLWQIAREFRLNYVLDGSNSDDVNDYRPGARAAQEHGVRSPLREVGLTKNEIRALSREMNLPTWDKPPAACLASRFPYGSRITPEKLSQVEKAENVIRAVGIKQVRVRHHGNTARIEVPPADFRKLLNTCTSGQIVQEMKRLGYDYVTLDLEGYRTGSMNEPLRKHEP